MEISFELSHTIFCVQLGTDTWFYAKRCLLSLLENMAKHMVVPVDSVIKECIQFLEQCEGEPLPHSHTPDPETMKLISGQSLPSGHGAPYFGHASVFPPLGGTITPPRLFPPC